MKPARTCFVLAATLAATTILAHPGHEAPYIHAHDIDEAAATVAVILLAAVIVAGIRAVASGKRKSRP